MDVHHHRIVVKLNQKHVMPIRIVILKLESCTVQIKILGTVDHLKESRVIQIKILLETVSHLKESCVLRIKILLGTLNHLKDTVIRIKILLATVDFILKESRAVKILPGTVDLTSKNHAIQIQIQIHSAPAYSNSNRAIPKIPLQDADLPKGTPKRTNRLVVDLTSPPLPSVTNRPSVTDRLVAVDLLSPPRTNVAARLALDLTSPRFA